MVALQLACPSCPAAGQMLARSRWFRSSSLAAPAFRGAAAGDSSRRRQGRQQGRAQALPACGARAADLQQLTPQHASPSPSPSSHASPAPGAAAAAAAAACLLLATAGPALALDIRIEPANALSLPTWAVHTSSVIEWVAAMGLMWRYGEVSGNPRWKGMAWGMLPCLGSAMCACTWHFFYNSPDLQFLVALQAALTVVGNCTCWFAAYRIYQGAQQQGQA